MNLRFVQPGEPLTFDFSTDYQWDAASSRFARTFMPYRDFARHQDIGPYLEDLDRRYAGYVAIERTHGRAPAVSISVPSLASQYRQAAVILNRLESYAHLPAFYDLRLDHVSVVNVDDDDDLPVYFPSGPDKAGHVVGSRYIVAAELDFGETLPPLMRNSSEPLAKVRRYDFKLSISGPSASMGITCQLANDYATGQFSTSSGSPSGTLLPALDPRSFGFDRFVAPGADVGSLLEEGLGLMPESILEFIEMRSNPDLRVINLDLVIRFPNMQIDDAQFVRYLNAVAHCADWVQRAL